MVDFDMDKIHDAGLIQLRRLWAKRRRGAAANGSGGAAANGGDGSLTVCGDGVGGMGAGIDIGNGVEVVNGEGCYSSDGDDDDISSCSCPQAVCLNVAPSSSGIETSGMGFLSSKVPMVDVMASTMLNQQVHSQCLRTAATAVQCAELGTQGVRGIAPMDNQLLAANADQDNSNAEVPAAPISAGQRSGAGVLPHTNHGVPDGRPSSAWDRASVVALPSRGELGEFAIDENHMMLDDVDVRNTMKRFEFALVGRLFGRRLPFHYLSSELRRRWDQFGNFKLVTISGDSFICFFDNVASRDAVLMGGPWIVSGQVLGIDKWSSSFSPSSSEGFVTPIWVRLPGLPMYCWGAKNMSRIGAMLGEPLWMDSATNSMERGQFARICVRMDLSRPLKPGVWLNGEFGEFFQATEYEGLSSFCFLCGRVGHKDIACSSTRHAMQVQDVDTVQTHVMPTIVENASVSPSVAPEADPRGFGPWMLVTRKKRPPRGHINQVVPKAVIKSHTTWKAKATGLSAASARPSSPVVVAKILEACNPSNQIEIEPAPPLESDLEVAPLDVNRCKSSNALDLDWGDFTPVAGKKAKKKKKKKMEASHRVTRSQVKQNFLPGALPPETPAGGAAPSTPAT